MGRTPLNLPSKRGRPNSSAASRNLSDVDKDVCNLIKSKEGMGVLVGELSRELKLENAIVNKSIKTLESWKLIKGVVNVRGKLSYMGVEFEPSKEITGGLWYVEGKLDEDFIDLLKDYCLKRIETRPFVTMEGLFDDVRRSGLLKVNLTSDQILEILRALVLDNEIEEVKSTGKGVFSSESLGKVCYRRLKRNSTAGIMSSVPCGVCPRISDCTPDGIISPINCVYFKKWLDF